MANINSILKLTEIEEGGLSRATTDTAHKFPSPYTYKGKKGWHTNRGITYKTFLGLKNKLGYSDTYENFILMPDEIFLKIAEIGYWDVLNLDKMNSQALANIFFSWQWGAGYGWRNRIVRYLKKKNIFWNKEDLKNFPNKINELVDKIGEKKAIDEIIEQFREFYKSLNQPKNLKGWLNRLNRLKNYSYTLIGEVIENIKGTATEAATTAKKNPIKTGVIILIILGIILKQINSKQ